MIDWLKELRSLHEHTLTCKEAHRCCSVCVGYAVLVEKHMPEMIDLVDHIKNATAAHSYRLMGQTWLRSAQQLIDAGDDEVSTMREFGYVRVSEVDNIKGLLQRMEWSDNNHCPECARCDPETYAMFMDPKSTIGPECTGHNSRCHDSGHENDCELDKLMGPRSV